MTVLAIVTGSMLAGFVGWTTFIVDRSDRERKRLEEVLQLRQEHLDRLLNAVEEPETEARLRRLVRVGVAGAVLLTGLLGILSWRMALQAARRMPIGYLLFARGDAERILQQKVLGEKLKELGDRLGFPVERRDYMAAIAAKMRQRSEQQRVKNYSSEVRKTNRAQGL